MTATTWRIGDDAGRARIPAACPACGSVPPAGPSDLDRPAVTSPEAAADVLVPWLAHHDRERCVAALLDTRHLLLGVEVVSIGSVDHTFMAPREVFRIALLGGASAIVVAHNHPSGDPEPSADDRAVTRRLARSAELVGVDLLDHLVVGRHAWVSLARRNEL